jgi:hypothetical protein
MSVNRHPRGHEGKRTNEPKVLFMPKFFGGVNNFKLLSAILGF